MHVNMWFENVEVLVKTSSSAVEHRSSKVGKSDSDGTADVQNPDLFARRRTASIRWRSVDVVKLHQAGETR